MEVRVRGRVPGRRSGAVSIASSQAGSGSSALDYYYEARVRPSGDARAGNSGTLRRGREIPTVQLVPETGLASIPAGWLLPELPTALLLAVFVGTGWLGYAGTDRPVPDPPLTAVVAPGGQDSLSVTFGER